jgi:DNA-binding transcriptional ArsR family regulator
MSEGADGGPAEPGGAGPGGADRDTAGQGGGDLAGPWAEPFGTGSPERAQLATEFGAAVRKTGSLMQLVGQAAADRIGINATDLNCLNILSFSGQMTAGELARATGLTTASITGVVDRLEDAGYVRRERDVRDRRRVVVHLVLDRAVRDVAPLFLPIVREWQQLADQYTDDELRLIVEFYRQMEETFRKHVVRLREPAEPGPSAAEPGAGA